MTLKHIALIFIASMCGGCATTDTARRIQRQCPTKFVYGEEAAREVAKGYEWTSGDVKLTGHCLFDSSRVCDWSRKQGISCGIKYEDAVIWNGFKRKTIKNGHLLIDPIGSKYYLSSTERRGLVRKRK